MKLRWPSPWIWVVLAALYLCLHFFIAPGLINSSPEFPQVTHLLKDNPRLDEVFGSVRSIDLDDVNNETNWSAQGLFGKGSCSGTYQFKITGALRTGVILVHWKSTPERHAQLISIDEVTSTGAYLSTIWKSPSEQASTKASPAKSLPTADQAAPRVTVIDLCIYFFAGVLVISLGGALIYFSRTARKTT